MEFFRLGPGFKEIMLETKPLLENLHWETSQDKSHQYYFCEPDNQADFEDLVTFIKKHGFVVTIQGQPYVCLDIGKYLYWTMWDSTRKANVINRMRI